MPTHLKLRLPLTLSFWTSEQVYRLSRKHWQLTTVTSFHPFKPQLSHNIWLPEICLHPLGSQVIVTQVDFLHGIIELHSKSQGLTDQKRDKGKGLSWGSLIRCGRNEFGGEICEISFSESWWLTECLQSLLLTSESMFAKPTLLLGERFDLGFTVAQHLWSWNGCPYPQLLSVLKWNAAWPGSICAKVIPHPFYKYSSDVNYA